jgi:hypothetical protein
MNKSVLVIDTPERGCISCPIGQNDSNCRITRIYCPIAEETAFNEEAETIPDWCPLKPLPERMTGVAQTDHWNIIKAGWNGCINKITGGEVDD